MNINSTVFIGLGIATAVALLATGCNSLNNVGTQHHATSLYTYLYPNKENHVDTPTIPVLSLPLRVGVAFVPVNEHQERHYPGYVMDDTTLSESQKVTLMKKISVEFKKYPFIQSIEIIPTPYLTPGGSFANLDQIRTMYGVDVITLLSYDQVQFTGEGWKALSYWTLAGAMVVPGEENETKTMLDAAVFDIASRKMLFRAPGIGNVEHSSTLMTLDENLHKNSEEAFAKAAADLTTNLQATLADFQERVTNSIAQSKQLGTNAPAEYAVRYKAGYNGAGALGPVEATVAAGLGACFLWTQRQRRHAKT